LVDDFSAKFNKKSNLATGDAFAKATSKFVAKMEIFMTMPEDAVVG
jgi:hypothetical protein